MKKIDSSNDAVIVGSGINSMAAGALLAQAGWRVRVLERSSELGSALQTGQITIRPSTMIFTAPAVRNISWPAA